MPDDVRGPDSPANDDGAHDPGTIGPGPNAHRTNGRSHPAPPFAWCLPPDDGETEAPIDLVAVQADDELVNAIGARPAVPAAGTASDQPDPGVGGASTDHDEPAERGTDDRLVAMLAAWRAEIDAEPIPELVDLDTAVAAVTSGMAQQSAARRRPAGRLRQLAPLVAAAAIIVATVTGVGLGSQNAVPGDSLWAIQKVVNPERAQSVEAKVTVESRLETVRTALKSGDTATAARELDAIRTEIPAVRGQEGRPQLVQEQDFLAAKLVDTKPGQPADLSTPPRSDPAARPTGAPLPPPPPPADSSATAPSVSASVPKSQPAESDVPKGESDRSKDAVAPAPPVRTVPDAPPPERPGPEVTSAPVVPLPAPPAKPAPPGKDVGKPDQTTDPGPVDQPPASTPDPGIPPDGGGGENGSAGGGDNHNADKHDGGGGSPGTTTAAGAAGANVETTVTDTTS